MLISEMGSMQRSLMSQSKVSIALKLRAIDEEKGGVVLEKEKHFGWLSEMVTARNLDIEVKAGCENKSCGDCLSSCLWSCSALSLSIVNSPSRDSG